MIKTLSLLILSAASASAFGQAPMLRPMAAPQTAQQAAATVLIDEDFSRFAAGSEDAPDASNIANLRTGVIDNGFTATPGWTGAAIYQAGGACAILTGTYSGDNGPYEDTGFLCTPLGNYAGDLTITFRARLLEGDADNMAVQLGHAERGLLDKATVAVGPQWQSYKVNFTKGLFADCMMQFAMAKAKVLIDDIRVESVATAIVEPEVMAATDFSNGGFTARWLASADATGYELNVYEKDVAGATHLVDFEDVNTTASGSFLDSKNPNLPKGWTFETAKSMSTSPVLEMKGVDGSRGMVFDATDEGFQTPTFDAPIRDFSFYARSLYGKPCFSRVEITVLIGHSWGALGNIDIERISPDGEIIDLSSRLPEGVRAIRLRYYKNTQNDAGKDIRVLVDNIRVMTEPARTATVATVKTAATSHRLEGLDPWKDYSYTVRAYNETLQSAESAEMMAAGLEAPAIATPGKLEGGRYTARWLPSPKAEGYLVNHYMVYTAPAPGEATLLYENFDKVSEGTLENPVGLYNVVNPLSLDKYTTMPGWLGLATYLVKGMLGTRSYYTAQGAIQTPALDLSGNGGRFDVKLTIVADTDASADQIVVQAGQANYQRVPVAKVGEPFEVNLTFDCGTAGMALLIYSYSGSPFYIDDITVSRHVETGERVFTLVSATTTPDTELEVTDVVPGQNEAAAYRVFAYRNFYGSTVYSNSSEARIIEDPNGIADGTISAEVAKVEYFTLQGIAIASPEVPGVYVRRALMTDGTVTTDKIVVK